MTSEQLAELREWDQKMTHAPWEVNEDGEISHREGAIGTVWQFDHFPCLDDDEEEVSKELEANAASIVAMRNRLPELLEEIERLDEEMSAVKGCLLWEIDATLPEVEGPRLYEKIASIIEENQKLQQRVRELEALINRHRPKALTCDGCGQERKTMVGRDVRPENVDLYKNNEKILCSVCLSNRGRL